MSSVVQEKIKEIVDKIPFGMLLVCYVGYLGYDYYDFINSDTSTIGQKKTEIETLKAQNSKLLKKNRELDIFVKTLEVKKLTLRKMAHDLQNVKAVLSKDLDVPKFMKLIFTEARSVGITVKGLEPQTPITKEFYSENSFKLEFKGVFEKLIELLDRFSDIAQIVRVEAIKIKPNGNTSGKYAEIEGTLDVRIYRYLGTKADTIDKSDGSSSSATPTPAVSPGVDQSNPSVRASTQSSAPSATTSADLSAQAGGGQ
jgi:Tfp pilus assembly protein PilO